jgi:hypothetical protein
VSEKHVVGLCHDSFQAQLLDHAQGIQLVGQFQQGEAAENLPGRKDPSLVKCPCDLRAAPAGHDDLLGDISERLGPSRKGHLPPPTLG